jgi:hypothetical protein
MITQGCHASGFALLLAFGQIKGSPAGRAGVFTVHFIGENLILLAA